MHYPLRRLAERGKYSWREIRVHVRRSPDPLASIAEDISRYSDYDAIIAGSGPNGLAAAITLARAGRRVLVLEAEATSGGGTRSAELTLPGFVHDICSAVHPLAVASPFFRGLSPGDLQLEWIHPQAPLAHPLDDGTAVMLECSVAATASTGAGPVRLVRDPPGTRPR